MAAQNPELLKAIAAAPDDDLPRVVYADWLDEHGDAGRAAFIRAQIEMAKHEKNSPQYHEALITMRTVLHDHPDFAHQSTRVQDIRERLNLEDYINNLLRNEDMELVSTQLEKYFLDKYHRGFVTQSLYIDMATMGPNYPSQWERTHDIINRFNGSGAYEERRQAPFNNIEPTLTLKIIDESAELTARQISSLNTPYLSTLTIRANNPPTGFLAGKDAKFPFLKSLTLQAAHNPLELGAEALRPIIDDGTHTLQQITFSGYGRMDEALLPALMNCPACENAIIDIQVPLSKSAARALIHHNETITKQRHEDYKPPDALGKAAMSSIYQFTGITWFGKDGANHETPPMER